jgi:hypothetical protein
VLWRDAATLYLVAPTGTTILHEEHHPVHLPVGTYRVEIVREYDYFADMARRVVD